jgi:alanine racemase
VSRSPAPEPPTEDPSWCEIDLAAVRANVASLRRGLSPGALLGVVVKANAYGHGLTLCARAFLAAGVDWLVANSVVEAERLRRAGIEAPLYLCVAVPPAQAIRAARTGVRVVLADPRSAEALDAAGRAAGVRVPVHLKVETGTHRQGVGLDDLLPMARRLVDLEGVQLEGLTTHYADIEDTIDHAFARRQLQLLEAARQTLADHGIAVPMVHSANSAATLLWPETHGSLVRAGLAAYGLWPSRETFATALQRSADVPSYTLPRLAPVLSWRTRILQLNQVPTGGYVGYGRTFRATAPTRLAVIPVGYYEGFDRRLSNLGHVLVRGVRAPVRGRVCMNLAMVDVTDVPGVEVGDLATLIGIDGEEQVSADQWASWMGTISYEVVSRIHPDQPRLALDRDGRWVSEEGIATGDPLSVAF